MTVTRPLILVVIAVLCFAIGLLLALKVITGGNEEAWLFGGLLAFAAAHLP